MQGPEPFHQIYNQQCKLSTTIKCFKVDYYICLFPKKKQKNLRYSIIIRINLFESNKNFTSAAIICNKLSANMHQFLNEQLSL